jgi:hypothetical protein
MTLGEASGTRYDEFVGLVDRVARDRVLTFHWDIPIYEWLTTLPLPPIASFRLRRARESILSEALLAYYGGWPAVSYSRRPQFYSGQGRYHGADYTYRTVVRTVDALTELGLLGNLIAPANPHLGRQSIFWATEALISAVPGAQIANARCFPRELVRLRNLDRRLVDYRETENTRRMRRVLAEQNEAVGSIDIELTGPDISSDGPVLRVGENVRLFPGQYCVYRVFNGDLKHGGRLYGGWWQNAPKNIRAMIRLDGQPTIEEDHAQLHPRLLYARAGRDLDGDAYTLPEWDRTLCKIAFNVLLNANSYHSALAVIANEIGGDNAYPRAGLLIREMKTRHAAVRAFFHTDVGLSLQNLDADMAEYVLKRLLRRGIVALPIHDSFVVQERHVGELKEAMNASFSLFRP